MAGTAYHMEALRKQRVIERKSEAMRKLQEGLGQSGDVGPQESKEAPLMFSESGHYAQNRLTYYKIGTVRDQRQYDHSRNGPIVDRTNRELRREFNFLGNSLSMLKRDIGRPNSAIPLCRRY